MTALKKERYLEESTPIFPRILHAELIVVFFLFITAYLYDHYGLALRNPLTLYLQRIEHGALLYAIGLLLCVFFVRLTNIKEQRARKKLISWRETLEIFRRRHLFPPRIIFDLRLIHAVCLMFVVFIQMKHLIPVLNPALYDEFFFASENDAFEGKLAGPLLIELLGSSIAPWVSEGYTIFYPFVAISIFVLIFQQDIEFRLKFFTAFVLIWFMGILIVYFVPTWGPCFYKPELFNNLPQTGVSKLQGGLWQQKLALDQSIDNSNAVFLISGFPSLHLAVVFLITLYMKEVNVSLSIASRVVFGLTAISTLYFGWHYVLDDVGALVLTFVVQYMAHSLIRRQEFKGPLKKR